MYLLLKVRLVYSFLLLNKCYLIKTHFFKFILHNDNCVYLYIYFFILNKCDDY